MNKKISQERIDKITNIIYNALKEKGYCKLDIFNDDYKLMKQIFNYKVVDILINIINNRIKTIPLTGYEICPTCKGYKYIILYFSSFYLLACHRCDCSGLLLWTEYLTNK